MLGYKANIIKVFIYNINGLWLGRNQTDFEIRKHKVTEKLPNYFELKQLMNIRKLIKSGENT